MERAVELRLLGAKWGEIERALNVPMGTLMRWQALPEWKVIEADWLAQDVLVRRAKAVVGRALLEELLTKGKPDTGLAERILAPRGNGDSGELFPGGYSAHPGVVILPMQNQGLESKPATQVLMQPTRPAPAPEPPPPPTKPGKRMAKESRKNPAQRRRVAGPDE